MGSEVLIPEYTSPWAGIMAPTLAQSKQLICLRILIKGTKCSITPIQSEPGPGTRFFPALGTAVIRTGKAGKEGNCQEERVSKEREAMPESEF